MRSARRCRKSGNAQRFSGGNALQPVITGVDLLLQTRLRRVSFTLHPLSPASDYPRQPLQLTLDAQRAPLPEICLQRAENQRGLRDR
jgi:hypothetical protein